MADSNNKEADMKTYEVTFFSKANRQETKHIETVEAASAKEAKQIVCESFQERTGKHAFRPATKWIH